MVSFAKFSGSGDTSPSSLFETTSDVELVHAMAPDAKILLVLTEGNGTLDGFSYVISHNAADIATMSWWQQLTNRTKVELYESEYAKSADEDITLVTISMDWGSNNTVPFPRCPNQPFCTNQTGFWTEDLPTSYLMPEYSPYVTVVGGTELRMQSGVYGTEVGWNRSGGGPSNIFSEPNWQIGPGVPMNGHRNIPDIALDASCSTPYYAYWKGRVGGFCGTSGAAPTFAGIIADIMQAAGGRLGFLNPTLYSLALSDPSVYHDVTSGCSLVQIGSHTATGYCSSLNWDFVTGWGSIDATKLASRLVRDKFALEGWIGGLTVTGIVVLAIVFARRKRRRRLQSAF